MPRSKRDKKISLTKTNKKGLQWKQQIIEDIRLCVKKYPNIFVFSVQNMRNNLLKELRQEWKKDSRFFFGKNRIMQIGLGRDDSEEVEVDLHKLANRLSGQCGLLFTNTSKDKVIDWFKEYYALEYARSGFIATETISLKEGPLKDFNHSMEPHLRSLGLPTELKKGIINLYKNYTVCEKGAILTPEQAKILKLIGKPMAIFRLTIKCAWTKDKGYESFTTSDQNCVSDEKSESSEEEMDQGSDES